MIEKLIKIQQELKAPKNQYNSFGGYSYRSCEDILNAVKPLLLEAELSLILSDELVQVGERYYIKATATLSDNNGHTISNTSYAREEAVKKGMDGSQITGASSSYARKYALNGLFLIDDVKDSDTTNTGDSEAEPTLEDAKKFVINFGKKYPGQLLADVHKKDTNYIDWIYENMKDNNYLIKCIDLLDKETPDKENLESDNRLNLLVEFEKLIIETNTDKSEIYDYYNVEDNTKMTEEQLTDAIKILKKKLEGKNGK